MSPRLVALAGCLLLLPSLAIAHPVSVGHVSAWMGDKWLDSYDAPCAAFDAMVGPGPVLLDIYGSGSWHSGSNSVGGLLDQNSYELGVGVGRIWSLGSFHPRLSAGFARAVLKERIRPDFDDYIERHFETWGSRGWIAVGGFWDTNIGPTLGLAARFSEIGHHDYPQLGGTHVAATLGWRWGLKRR